MKVSLWFNSSEHKASFSSYSLANTHWWETAFQIWILGAMESRTCWAGLSDSQYLTFGCGPPSLALSWLSSCIGQLSTTVTKYLISTNSRRRKVISAQSFGSWSGGSITFRPVEQSCSPHDSQEAERRGRTRGAGDEDHNPSITGGLTSFFHHPHSALKLWSYLRMKPLKLRALVIQSFSNRQLAHNTLAHEFWATFQIQVITLA